MAKRKKKNRLSGYFWMADTTGCGFDRCMTPAGAMRRSGWNVLYGTHLRLDIAQTMDFLVGQRISTEEAMPLWRYLAHSADSPALIYEVDDNLFKVERHNRGSYEFYAQPFIRDNMAEAIMLADALCVTNVHLATELSRYNENIIILPNFLPAGLLTKPVRQDRDTLRLGWAGGSSHYEDIMSVREPLRAVLERSEGVQWVNYGMDYRETLGLEGEYVGWSNDKIEYMRQLHLDIGLCPLTDSLFNRCKTPVKALEYAFKGIPTVASNVTPYKEFVIHGETGFLASTPGEWEHYITLLIEDEGLRHQMSDQAYDFAKTQTMEGNVEPRSDAFRQIIEAKDAVRAEKAPILRSLRQRTLQKPLRLGLKTS